MNVLNKLALSCASVVLMFGLTACDKPGPAETAGKKLDDAASEVSKKIESAVDKASSEIKEQAPK